MKKIITGIGIGLLALGTYAATTGTFGNDDFELNGNFTAGQKILADDLEDVQTYTNKLFGAFNSNGTVKINKLGDGSSNISQFNNDSGYVTDASLDDSNFVHKTGDETIQDTKTFEGNILTGPSSDTWEVREWGDNNLNINSTKTSGTRLGLQRDVDDSIVDVGNSANNNAKFDVYGTAQITKNLIVNDNVGIGTDTPSTKLEVNGGIKYSRGTFQDDGYWSKEIIRREGDGGGARKYIYGYEKDGTTQTDLSIAMKDASNNNVISFNTNGNSFLNGGNVGIGTDNPSNKLTISGTDTQGIDIKSTSRASINLYPGGSDGDGSNRGQLSFKDNNGDSMWSIQTDKSNNGSDQDMFFYDGTTDGGDYALYLKQGGNVGIGTTTPSAKLEVNGSLKVNGDLLTDAYIKNTGGAGLRFNSRNGIHSFIDTDNDESGNSFTWNKDNGSFNSPVVRLMTLGEDAKLSVEGSIETKNLKSPEEYIKFRPAGSNDDDYERAGWYSGSSRAGIFLWDGSWNGCDGNKFCIVGDTHQLMLKSLQGNVLIDDNVDVNGIISYNMNSIQKIYIGTSATGDGSGRDGSNRITLSGALDKKLSEIVEFHFDEGEYHIDKGYYLRHKDISFFGDSSDHSKVKLIFDSYDNGSYNYLHSFYLTGGQTRFSYLTIENGPKSDDGLNWALGSGEGAAIVLGNGYSMYGGATLSLRGVTINQSSDYLVSAKHSSTKITFMTNTINASDTFKSVIYGGFGVSNIALYGNTTNGNKITTRGSYIFGGDGGETSRIDNNLSIYGGLNFSAGAKINEFSTDGTLAGNSDNAIPTEKAVKTYVDNNSGGGTAFAAGKISSDTYCNEGNWTFVDLGKTPTKLEIVGNSSDSPDDNDNHTWDSFYGSINKIGNSNYLKTFGLRSTKDNYTYAKFGTIEDGYYFKSIYNHKIQIRIVNNGLELKDLNAGDSYGCYFIGYIAY